LKNYLHMPELPSNNFRILVVTEMIDPCQLIHEAIELEADVELELCKNEQVE